MSAIGMVPWNMPQGFVLSQTSGVPAFTNFVLDATTDEKVDVFQADAAIVITHVGFRYGARALTPPTYIIGLQGVTNGVNDGTFKGGASPASVTFTPPASTAWNGTWQWLQLANAYTTTRGEELALVIAYSSGTVNGTNNSSFTSRLSMGIRTVQPYTIENNAGSRAVSDATPVFGYKSSTTSYGYPIESVTATSVNSNSTPDEYALYFSPFATVTGTAQLAGVVFAGTLGVAAKTCKVILYDTDGTSVLQTVTWDADDTGDTGVRSKRLLFTEVTLATLTCGSFYRLAFQPQETTTAMQIVTLDMDTNAELSAYPGGSSWYLNTRTDAGAWTNDVTVNFRLPLMVPLMVDLSPTSGSGGSAGALVFGG